MLTVAIFIVFLVPHGDLSIRILEKSEEIERHPENGLLYMQRGELYMQHEQPDSALADFLRSLELKPDTSTVYILLADAYLTLGEHGKGMVAVEEFLKQEPAHLKGIHTRACLFKAMGRLNAAVHDFEFVLNKGANPRPQDYMELAELYIRKDSLDPAAAISVLNRGLDKLGNIISLQLKIYELERQRLNFQAAHQMLDKMMEPLSRKERLLVEKAEVYLQEGNLAEAAQFLVHAENAIAQLPVRLTNVPATANLKEKIARLKQQL